MDAIGNTGYACRGLAVDRILGLRGQRCALFGSTAVAEHQQHVTAAIHGGGRHGAHDCERLAGIVNHLFDRRHRVARREALAQAGAHQQIPFLDVCGVGHVA